MAAPRKPRLKARVAIEQNGHILCVLHAKPREEPFWCLPGGNVDDARDGDVHAFLADFAK